MLFYVTVYCVLLRLALRIHAPKKVCIFHQLERIGIIKCRSVNKLFAKFRHKTKYLYFVKLLACCFAATLYREAYHNFQIIICSLTVYASIFFWVILYSIFEGQCNWLCTYMVMLALLLCSVQSINTAHEAHYLNHEAHFLTHEAHFLKHKAHFLRHETHNLRPITCLMRHIT